MNHPRVIINLLPVSKGGGLQNALSFLRESDLSKCLVICRDLEGLVIAARSRGAKVLAVKGGVASRLIAELSLAFRFPAGTKIFTLFGPPPILSSLRYLNITGFAYSNLLYPEIDFWSAEPVVRRQVRRIKDVYRRWGVSKADYWIFETDVLANRALELFSFPAERTAVVKMAPGSWVSAHRVERAPSDKDARSPFRVLYLTGYHTNKRIERLLNAAVVLKAQGRDDFRFVVTVDSSVAGGLRLQSMSEQLGVQKYFDFIGRVPVREVPRLIASCDAMCNLAVLESFSNNIVEAWVSERPLVITDSDWARSACGGGAYFVDPNQPAELAGAFMRLADSAELRGALVAEGLSELATYPSVGERVAEYWRLIDSWSFRASRVCVWRRSQ